MCGIVGIFNREISSINIEETTRNMLSKIAHRGPDDEGLVLFSESETSVLKTEHSSINLLNESAPYLNFNSEEAKGYYLSLGHRRLAIIDQSYWGHQPMSTPDGKFWIVYNGEVYNYQKLRLELEAKGVRFYSDTDSEVVLNGYKVWGKEVLKRLNGMFAFAIYDTQEQILFAARDPFGVKPFYFFKTEKEFVFASEQKAFLAYPNYKLSINQKSLFNYLTIGQIEEETNNFWAGINELQPGNFLEFNLKTRELNVKSYYKLAFNQEANVRYSKIEEENYVERVEELLSNSIKNHLKADVEVGSCLSGGIDSSVIVGMVAATLADNCQQHTFSSIFEQHKNIDESYFARLVSDKHKTIWNSVTPTSNQFSKDIQELCYAQDVPFFSSSTYSQFRVMQLVAETGIKVTLDGQGADELFSGYNSHYSSHIWELIKGLQLKSAAKNIGFHKKGFKQLTEPLKYVLASEGPELFKRSFENKKPAFSFLKEEFYNSNKVQFNSYSENWKASLNEQLYHEFTGTRLKNLMRTGDRNSMHFSVESRMPFVDDIPLVEYVFSIPGMYKIKNKISKYLLREAAEIYLPSEIYSRQDKVGFSTPEKIWLSEQKEQLFTYLPESDDEFIKWAALKNNWDEILLKNQDTSGVWRVLNFGIWKKVFLEGTHE